MSTKERLDELMKKIMGALHENTQEEVTYATCAAAAAGLLAMAQRFNRPELVMLATALGGVCANIEAGLEKAEKEGNTERAPCTCPGCVKRREEVN